MSLFFHPRWLNTAASRILIQNKYWGRLSTGLKVHQRPGQAYRNHINPRLAINFVLRGQGMYQNDRTGQRYALEPGSIFFRLPNLPHTTEFDLAQSYTEFYLAFDPITSKLLVELGMLDYGPVISGKPNQLVVEELVSLQDRVKLPEELLSSGALLAEVLHGIHRCISLSCAAQGEQYWHQIVARARLYLEKNVGKRISLPELASRLRVSYPSLRRNFREIAGTSLGSYAIRKRIERACVYLTDHSVAEVADKLDYPDPFTFSAQFKSLVGVPPRVYQKQHSIKP